MKLYFPIVIPSTVPDRGDDQYIILNKPSKRTIMMVCTYNANAFVNLYGIDLLSYNEDNWVKLCHSYGNT